jgi:hypothetical protein
MTERESFFERAFESGVWRALPALNKVMFDARVAALTGRIESACVVASMGADKVGCRTLNSLMGRMSVRTDDSCNRQAAALISIALTVLLQAAPPALIERISRAIAEHEFEVEGPE